MMKQIQSIISILQTYSDLDIYDVYRKLPMNRLVCKTNISKKTVHHNMMLSTTSDSNNDTTYMLLKQCNDLDTLKQIVNSFNGCELKTTAKNTVFGDGNPKSQIMLIGEAPGANEDAEGIPFCGQSGRLLDNILSSIGLNRQKVYITNTVFWRPPNNRRPTSEEIAICRPFVEKHISLVLPKLIILVGSTAVEALLQSNIPITKLRGHYFDYTNDHLQYSIKSTAIFHPSYLLRQPSQKKLMWFDVLKIKNDIGIDSKGDIKQALTI